VRSLYELVFLVAFYVRLEDVSPGIWSEAEVYYTPIGWYVMRRRSGRRTDEAAEGGRNPE